MKLGEEIRRGYIYCILGSVLVSAVVSVWGAFEEAANYGFLKFFGAFFGGLFVFGFWGFLFTAVFGGVIGVPLYYVLRKFHFANVASITLIGGLTAYLYGVTQAGSQFLHVLFVIYGAVSAFFFWLGSHVERKKL